MATVVEVEVSNGAVRDGEVLLYVDKLGGWLTVRSGRSELNTGATFRPASGLVLSIPMDIKEGEFIQIHQLAELLQKNLEGALPACQVFVNQSFEREDF